MKVSRVSLALVCSVFLAAVGASAGSSFAAGSADALTASAYQALSAGNATQSVEQFSQAISSQQLGPEALANAYLNRALAFQKLGQDSKAVEDYTAALNLDAMPTDIRARALYNRGLAQERVKSPVLAIEDYTSSLLIDANFSQSYLARANALRDSGQYLFSISDYERAIKNNHPQPAVVYFGEAQAYEALKRPIEAKKFLKAALQADPKFAPAQEKMKAYSDVAELDDAAADPILTGSLTSPVNQTNVAMKAMPQAVEPPTQMLAEATQANNDDASTAADQIADMAADEGSYSSLEPKPAKFGRVEVAQVPNIPAVAAKAAAQAQVAEAKPVIKQATQKAAQVAVIQPASDDANAITDSDPIATASTGQAPDVASTSVMSGWVVQISSANSEDAAWSSWKKMQGSHAVLAGENASVIKADLGARGTFYRVRMGGYDNQTAAMKACLKIKAGGVACYVAKASS
ncbi:SPOR domain-containing protein [Aestuariivirga litoralis]|uniref:SPOR domain-containing protein n=1 Tax=Aestuariivirga litoralis TaxID=2650924 RepID=UPI0018C67019|nr:SPOR domain-containing protein [Aestuariivirga litoralis]MBG1231356.1 hypothetical protein [Aestuariivirga litoralis]